MLQRAIFALLLATIALTAIPYGTVQPWWIAVLECLIFAIAILGIVETLIGEPWPRSYFPFAMPPLILTLFVLVQSLPLIPGSGPVGAGSALSSDPFATRLVAIELFAVLVFGLLLLRHTQSEARLRKLIYIVIAVGLTSACYGILRKGSGVFLPGLTVIDRSFGQFVNRNHFAFLMEMCLGLALGLIVAERDRPRWRLVWVASAGLLWVALIYSNSRGGILASLCQMLFIGVMLDPVGHLTTSWVQTGGWVAKRASGVALRVFLGVCLVVLFAIGVSWIGGEPVVFNLQRATTDFSQQEMQDNANTSRKEIWRATWQMIKAHPLTGVGFGAYRVTITRFHNASGAMTPQQAHNDYLELAAAGGLVGCTLAAWFLVAFVGKARKSLSSPGLLYRSASLGALAGLFAVAVHSFVDFGLHVGINTLVFTALIVIAVRGGLRSEPFPQHGPGSGLARGSLTQFD